MPRLEVRLVITGATGLIGSKLRQLLKSEGIVVNCPSRINLVNEVEKFKPTHILNCIGAGIDFRKNQSEDQIWEANYRIPMELVQIAEKLNSHFINIGSILEKVNGFNSPYIDSKRALSRALAKKYLIGLNSISLLTPIVFGLGREHALISDILESSQSFKAVNLESPKAIRDFIHIVDLHQVIQRLFELEEFPYDSLEIGSGRGYQLSTICENVLYGRVSPTWLPLSSNRTNNYRVVADLTNFQHICKFKLRYELETWLALEIIKLEEERK